jgi:NADH-quinone oxidoreductase subunit F
MPVQGMLKHFRDEFVHHIEHKRCLVGPGAAAVREPEVVHG